MTGQARSWRVEVRTSGEPRPGASAPGCGRNPRLVRGLRTSRGSILESENVWGRPAGATQSGNGNQSGTEGRHSNRG